MLSMKRLLSQAARSRRRFFCFEKVPRLMRFFTKILHRQAAGFYKWALGSEAW